jgi:hypothetical protein
MINEVCYSLGSGEGIAAVVTGVITVASVVANLVPTDTKLGKVIHLLAVNLKVTKK